MTRLQHRRIAFMVAAIAMLIALAFMLMPHSHQADHDAWAAILPILFVGLISPLSLLPALAYSYSSRLPDAPSLPASFQRPPPIALA
jgi:hypothetical protein